MYTELAIISGIRIRVIQKNAQQRWLERILQLMLHLKIYNPTACFTRSPNYIRSVLLK